MLHEPVTITLIRKHLRDDIFGSELALGVLALAINDIILGRKAKPRSPVYLRGKTVHYWILEPGGRFDFWCNHLGLEPKYVRKLIRREINFNADKKRRRGRSKVANNASG